MAFGASTASVFLRAGAAAAALAAGSAGASAQSGEAAGEDRIDQGRYEACLQRVGAAPEAAYEDGLAWRSQGGGWPARHCVALALIAQGEFEEGARRLASNAEAALAAGETGRAIMLGQAGDAWLLAEAPEQALEAFSRGLDFAPDDAGLRLGRAEAAAALGDWSAAESYAGEAIAADPDAPHAWRLRGEARLEQGDLEGAEADMTEARRLAPEDVDVLLLRGRINEARRAG